MPFTQVEDLLIHYEIAGKGDPIVFLHGLSNNSQSWRKQLDGLKDHFTVIAWDAPGYGQSSNPKEEFREFSQFADVLHGFIKQLQYDSVYLVGHSMGSCIAVDFTVRYPSMVKSLILADATRGSAALSKEENEKRLQNRLQSIENLDPKEMAAKRIDALLGYHPQEDIKKEAERIMGQVRLAGYRAVSYSLYHVNQMETMTKIAVPTLVICGEEDRVTPVSESQVFHERIANSQMVTIPKTGHLCYQEDSVSFNEYVAQFFKQPQLK
ncbi:alpha/beta fold hydrolase [Niallia endozanthoxylica]|uniref:Alpha/beta hydrolase n=1 Tax=Niallia endozanthoxylica TaxID=2036016 RepID=A0A5J5H8M7_9BACI|nr:alpha/beta hydrolase [Niallia endozanthoxylica]KAA9015973.1 alpha/beta hydrolase [Niallia endozanthoxylica]